MVRNLIKVFSLIIVSGTSIVAYAATPISLQSYPVYDPARVEQYTPVVIPQSLAPDKIITKEIHKTLPISSAAQAIKFKLNKINFVGNTIFSQAELNALVNNYIGKEIGFAQLQKVADSITLKYRNAGYILSQAIIPAQSINNGVVQIRVIEGHISKVTITGNGKGAEKLLEKYGEKLRKNGPLKLGDLERYILLTEDLNGVDIQVIITPSPTEFGAAELNFVIRQKKVNATLGFNNYGSYYYGREQVYPSISINDVTHHGDSLMYYMQFPRLFSNRLRYYALDYGLPLGTSGLKFDLSGGYTKTYPGSDMGSLGLEGSSDSMTAKFSYPIIRSRRHNLVVDGMFTALDSRLDYIQPLYVDHIRLLALDGTYNFLDTLMGSNKVSVTLSKGLHAFGASNTDYEPLSRPNGRSDFTKINSEIARLQNIGGRYSLLLDAVGQYSFRENLLSSAEFGVGGAQIGRAYDSSEITGDNGIAGIAEFRIDTNPDLSLLHQIQYYGYYDIGKVWNNGNIEGQESEASLASTGIGVRVVFNKYFTSEVEVDKPLTRRVQSQVNQGKTGKGFAYYFETRLTI